MNSLKEAILLFIAKDAPLGPQWLDHALKGNWAGHRECHIGGDFLLAYKRNDTSKSETAILVRTGSHSDLFED